MKRYLKYVMIAVFLSAATGIQPLAAKDARANAEQGEGELNVKELILDHLADSYEWHMATFGDFHLTIPLPVIVKGKTSGWHVFMSTKFHHGHDAYEGFYIAHDGEYKGKIVEKNASGEEIRPLDFSLTKNATGLIISSALLLVIVMSIANRYRKQEKSGEHKAPDGFAGFMEMFIMSVQDDIIKPCAGKNYRKFSPYLLTVFFFIFFNNIMGLLPVFPGGANVTGNIAITLVLALATFLVVNFTGTREYWKEIFNPYVPSWLKPLMIPIELVGMFTKPFALMIRLFANILAGHSIVLGLTCLIFVTVNLGTVINSSMTVVSVLLTIFISLVEILVAYIQAYVFTMLSAVFIGLAQVEPHRHAEEKH
ncbi:MAG: F0F1 ATP synthase subunit A [Prevotella sp.]|jgi:F-type H+-transporting ATPase subunit a|nr:F0F1 ATP synthase subunit A [Prevotella sp.]